MPGNGTHIVRMMEALETVPVQGFFVIEERKARFLDQMPEGAEPVPIPDRNWAQIVTNTEEKTNRAKIITTVSRSRAIRRMKQEARRLGDPKWIISGGELQFRDGDTDVYTIVASFRWKGEPRGVTAPEPEPEDDEPDLEEAHLSSNYITKPDTEVILAMQAVITENEVPDLDLLKGFLEVKIFADMEGEEPIEEFDHRKRKKRKRRYEQRESWSESTKVCIEEALVLPLMEREPALCEIWSSLGLRYLLVPKPALTEALTGLSGDDWANAFSIRAIPGWPGMNTFKRLLAEDRLVGESPDGSLMAVSSGLELQLPGMRMPVEAHEAVDHTTLLLDWQDLCDVDLQVEGLPGDSSGARLTEQARGEEDDDPAEARRRQRPTRRRQKQGRLFECEDEDG